MKAADRMNKPFLITKVRTMTRNNKDMNQGKDPSQVYKEELENKGSSFLDNSKQSEARDKAKIDKALAGESQKMDSVDPEELRPTKNDEILEREKSND
jgi:hypothetical protein